ncbi:MAG: hypothetical protein ACOYXA_18260 [Bacteroidota bacterium]
MEAIQLHNRIRKITVQGRGILCIDYTGLREAGMIALGTEATHVTLAETEPQCILTCFSNTYVTPAFVRHMERQVELVRHLILRNALVGLNRPKMMILKGFNLVVRTDFKPFASEAEALAYLLREPLIEEVGPMFNQPTPNATK